MDRELRDAMLHPPVKERWMDGWIHGASTLIPKTGIPESIDQLSTGLGATHQVAGVARHGFFPMDFEHCGGK